MWHRWMAVALLLWTGAPAAAKPLAEVKHKLWERLLEEASTLRDNPRKASQVLRAKKLWRAYRLRPRHFRSLEAALKACMINAGFAKKKSRIKMWGKSGWVLAKQMVKRWPKRAEGYFWRAIHIGQYARGAGIWAAMTQRLAGKIVKGAEQSLKRNRKLYRGGAQRILGRYYFRVPWPWRSFKKSLRYLQEAHKLAPRDVTGLRFLAETHLALGHKTRAVRFFRRCASSWTRGLRSDASASRCRQWLRKHKP